MIHFNKSVFLAMLAAALFTACGQSTTDTASSTPQQSNLAASSSQPSQATASSPLLQSLAAVYPDGQIQASNAAQAAKELAQNPAALKITAQSAPITAQNTGAPIQAQATSADYKAVIRIQNTTLTGAYFFTIYDSERTTALANNPNWALEGPAFWASLASGTGLSPVHRFRNNLNGSYLYTIYETEKADIQANLASTFFYEGVAWYAQQTQGPGWSPLYRFRNLLNGTYLFSAFETEKDAIVANYSAVFELEGVAYYVRQDAPTYALVLNSSGGFYDKTECVKDLRTGLIWQGQTPAGTGLRANDQYKTNYDSATAFQKDEILNVAPSLGEINAVTNSVGYKNAVNATNLCGVNTWRIPTQDELLSIIATTASCPGIDSYWFPNTRGAYYWTSTAISSSPSSAVFYDFTCRNNTTQFGWRGFDPTGAGGVLNLYARFVRLVH